MLFELRVFKGTEVPYVTCHANPMDALENLAVDTTADKGFAYAWAECWLLSPQGDTRQWKLIID